MNDLQWFIGFTGCASLVLFSVIFHRTRADLLSARNFGIPFAVVHDKRASADLGQAPLRSRMAAAISGGMPTVQAGIVAIAATSVLVMSLCLMACVVLAVAGR